MFGLGVAFQVGISLLIAIILAVPAGLIAYCVSRNNKTRNFMLASASPFVFMFAFTLISQTLVFIYSLISGSNYTGLDIQRRMYSDLFKGKDHWQDSTEEILVEMQERNLSLIETLEHPVDFFLANWQWLLPIIVVSAVGAAAILYFSLHAVKKIFFNTPGNNPPIPPLPSR